MKDYKLIYETEDGTEEFVGTKKECQVKFCDYQKDIYNLGLDCEDLRVIKISTGELIDLGYSCEDGDGCEIFQVGYGVEDLSDIPDEEPIWKMNHSGRFYYFYLKNGNVVKTPIHPDCK